MKITRKTKLSKYLTYKLLSDIDDSIFKDMPLNFKLKRVGLPLSVWDITFEKFITAIKYLDNTHQAPYLLEEITNVNKIIWLNSKVFVSLPLYLHYIEEIKQVLEMIKEVSEEAPKPKSIGKDMSVFGLNNIVALLSVNSRIDDPEIYNMSVSSAFGNYKYKIDTMINQIAESKID